MKHRFRVGEIAKLFRISASTLRYYDEIGLFRPKYTDPENQYRFYTVEQFVVLDTIIFLKKNGFSIKDIQEQLENRTPTNSVELLERKLGEVEEEIQRLNKMHEKIRTKITTIREGLSLSANPTHTYRRFPARAVRYYYNHTPVHMKEVFYDLYVKSFEEHSSAGYYNGFFTGDFGAIADFESLLSDGPLKYRAAFEILHHKEDAREVSFLNAGMYACYPHQGPYERAKESYSRLLQLLKQDGYRVAGDPIEVSMLDESVIRDEEGFVTWLQIPVEYRD